MFTGRIPASIAQDIDEEVTAKIRLPQRVTASSPEYFVRLDECSTKDGVGGVGPFTTAHEVVKALCTSKRVGQALKRVLRSTEQRVGTYLHLLPWKPFDETNEFRAFIAQRRLVALSQYKWKEDLGWADPSRERMLQEIVADVETLVSELNQRAQNADKNMPECYVLDVHVSLVKSEDEQVWSSARVEPIELNSFGAQMAAGSALFHWIHDHQRLYGLLDGIEVRVVSSANHGDNDEVENVYK
ncbi:uncharacterized protein SPPG_06893 [Spizellomyces punctatus DAOM BR117]|uniref:Uncharacterized protein n=1 Tax=Spizellomyces punctatus (strain DAOM BR117) TaxID=645134 RepID=A0A0L0H9N4_SPIPD|nr:uncharacterized protein SPPG_06893 [Spizellomyces punctatus DAOM BR117]KNC97902.1 hypothetical protein SPPG_06893 [Spizellomyces punctatus DAOM BR117]|eukprot:XP_016605942.1 hypothetical protein SPPG_06893 [Spizellomyces punctatus DAOM BR117]